MKSKFNQPFKNILPLHFHFGVRNAYFNSYSLHSNTGHFSDLLIIHGLNLASAIWSWKYLVFRDNTYFTFQNGWLHQTLWSCMCVHNNYILFKIINLEFQSSIEWRVSRNFAKCKKQFCEINFAKMSAKFRKNDRRLKISVFGRFLESKNRIFDHFFDVCIWNTEFFLKPFFLTCFYTYLFTRHLHSR